MEVINLTSAQMVHMSMLELRPASPSLALVVLQTIASNSMSVVPTFSSSGSPPRKMKLSLSVPVF